MGQLRVRFTVEHHNEQSSFTCLEELQQQTYCNLLLTKVADFEARLKRAAADVWLQKKLGALIHPPFEICIIHEVADSTTNDFAQRA
ncbi:hypothetical protein [Paenibacillus sp. JDR-2]|uniref:hypothetical protein n=1 Tax=Paenibacillus sp. (strain JDR-2) TaxID=324057 RepID=UPI00059F68B8|nr:hypothetical protein [Paenibacillus sp. JDR-2]